MEYMEQKMQELLDSVLHQQADQQEADQQEAELNEAVQETKPEGWHYIARYYD